MEAIPVRIRRLLFLAAVFLLLVVPTLFIVDLRGAVLMAILILVVAAWLFPTKSPARPEGPQDKTIGTEGHDVGNWDPDDE